MWKVETMTTLSERLAELSGKATDWPWTVDGEPDNQIIWSSPTDRVCFMAHSNGRDTERDIATAALIVELVNAYRAGRLIVKD